MSCVSGYNRVIQPGFSQASQANLMNTVAYTYNTKFEVEHASCNSLKWLHLI